MIPLSMMTGEIIHEKKRGLFLGCSSGLGDGARLMRPWRLSMKLEVGYLSLVKTLRRSLGLARPELPALLCLRVWRRILH